MSAGVRGSTQDWGHANFNDSAGARNVIAGLNPLTPGGMNPRNTSLPTIGWVLVFLVVAFLLYHTILRRR